MDGWDKTDIIHFLTDLYGYRRYPEICKRSTGGLYGKIDRSRFGTCHRLMYRCPASYDDGMEVNFRSPDMRTDDLFGQMRAWGLSYDVVLVDSFHTYDASYRDLVDAVGIITEQGTVVVHDCYPPDENLIAPEWVVGAWCGVSFIAFIDFLRNNPQLTRTTVDTD